MQFDVLSHKQGADTLLTTKQQRRQSGRRPDLWSAPMLFHVSFRVEHTRLDRDEFWDEWERETQAALGAIEAGIIKSLYKVAGQRRVIGIMEVESHDQLNQIVMGALPMSHHLTLEEVLPVREYTAFAEDIRRRWQS